MSQLLKPFGLGLLLVAILLPPLHAQNAPSTTVETGAAAARPAPAGQAPEEMTKKIAELVHAGNYAEAQQLTAGLLIAYPADQRLVKAKAVIEKLRSPANADPNGSPATNDAASAQPRANVPAELLTGMDKVDFNALIALARQAKQTADLAQQKKLLQQFMDQSRPFLQKHPMQVLLWQLRAASAISLNDPMAGYEAGQKLIAAGAADSNDPNVEQLLAELTNKGWLDRQEAEKAAKEARYEWLVGAWSNHYSTTDKRGHTLNSGDEMLHLSISDSHIEGYKIRENGVQRSYPSMTLTILDSGEARCAVDNSTPVLSCSIDNTNKTIRVVFRHLNKEDKDNMHVWELKK